MIPTIQSPLKPSGKNRHPATTRGMKEAEMEKSQIDAPNIIKKDNLEMHKQVAKK